MMEHTMESSPKDPVRLTTLASPADCRPPSGARAPVCPGSRVPGQGAPGNCDRFFALLSEFYAALPEPPVIEATFVPTESIPQPQRDLLVHFSDMTSTLTRHYGERMTLKVLHRHEGPQWYRRHIVLETESSRQPVEYGAMRILLPLLSEAARLDVLAARAPLGTILACHGLGYCHCPGGFFKIRSNRLIEQSLRLSAPQWLYGRCNCMSDSVGRVVAEVVEILPPFNPEPGQSGYPLAGRGSATA
jgi:hypothetical protein